MLDLKLAAAAVVACLSLAGAGWVKFEAVKAEADHLRAVRLVELERDDKQREIEALTAEVYGLNLQLLAAEKSAEIEARLSDQSRKIRSISDVIATEARRDPGLQGAIDPQLKRALVGLDGRMRAQAAEASASGRGDGQAADPADGAGVLPGSDADRR